MLRAGYKNANHDCKRRGGGFFTIHQSCDKGKGNDLDGQHGHIIGRGQNLHLPVDRSCKNRVYNDAYKFNIIILTGEDE